MISSTGTRNVDRETVAVIQGRMMGIGCGVLGEVGRRGKTGVFQKTMPLGQCVGKEKQFQNLRFLDGSKG